MTNTISLAFSTLPLNPATLDNLQQLGYLAMTPIQAASLPTALAGRDLIAQAQTGSGKTAAFGLALLERLNPRRFAVQALVLCPTRELADQVAVEIRRLARALDNIKVVTLCGGVALRGQRASLENGAHIVVGTPGRVMDHLARGYLALDALTTLVLDEADRMLDMGFINDVRRLSKATHPERQTALYSATMPDELAELAKTLLRNPVRVEAAPPATTVVEIKQGLVIARVKQKRQVLSNMLADERMKSVIVFSRTKHGADRVTKDLERDGFNAAVIHGNKSQNARQKALNDFRDGSVRILVATDIAARGIDVPGISHVVNYDLPDEPESYVHRIGRTGRNGADGVAITMCDPAEFSKLRAVERITRMKIAVIADHTDQPDPAVNKSEPREAPYRDPRSQPRQENGNHNGNRNHKGGGNRSAQGKPGGGAPAGERKPFRGKRRGFGGKPAARAA
ncbi:MAG: DEAD/DEAH box helicase [Rhodoferax sp.]|uniref:DEAD/DEAH box helicase n=1 Tax=Rhodoferax sp. TaxID=50421 RepID=UPI00273267A5|nr:DEAD/DEAH box helicase [Rhodoferax sp.]MDP3866361.1 DEAD/DEAH box helicase [Rhodoferax sp.]